MPRYQLAQLNIASPLAAMDSPALADFVANLDRINQLAENSPGFVWRFEADARDPSGVAPFDPADIVNYSVWRDPASLHHFVFHTAHIDIMRRRKEWFSRLTAAYSVLWWVPEGHQPTPAEAYARLRLLRERGPTADAFTLNKPFPMPPGVGPIAAFDDSCPAT